MVDRKCVEGRCQQVRPSSKACGMDWVGVGLNPLLTLLAHELTGPEARRVA